MITITHACEICLKQFQIAARYLKHRPGRFCSAVCRDEFFARIPSYSFCLTCNQKVKGKKGGIRKYCSLACYWKKLKSIHDTPLNKQGYVKTKDKDGKIIYMHRLVMERAIGRPLLTTEIVHHINGDKLDNRRANLEIISQSTHIKEHFSPLRFGRLAAKPAKR